MNENQIKNAYVDNLKRFKSTNGNQAIVITVEQLAMFATLADIIKQNKAASESVI